MSKKKINRALQFVNENQEYFTDIKNGNIEIDFDKYKLNYVNDIEDISILTSDMLAENEKLLTAILGLKKEGAVMQYYKD